MIRVMRFLDELEENNNREWFLQHKDEYKELIYPILEEVFHALYDEAAAFDPDAVRDQRKCICRIYNDQRMHNKPYLKNKLWITFKSGGESKPVYFVEIAGPYIRYGMGYFRATSQIMRQYREKIDQHTKAFRDALQKITSNERLEICGEPYKRKFPNPYEEALSYAYNLKGIYVAGYISRGQAERMTWDEEIEQIRHDFRCMGPLLRFLL